MKKQGIQVSVSNLNSTGIFCHILLLKQRKKFVACVCFTQRRIILCVYEKERVYEKVGAEGRLLNCALESGECNSADVEKT